MCRRPSSHVFYEAPLRDLNGLCLVWLWPSWVVSVWLSLSSCVQFSSHYKKKRQLEWEAEPYSWTTAPAVPGCARQPWYQLETDWLCSSLDEVSSVLTILYIPVSHLKHFGDTQDHSFVSPPHLFLPRSHAPWAGSHTVSLGYIGTALKTRIPQPRRTQD